MKTVFIVNPAAGHARAKSRWGPQAEAFCDRPETAVWETRAPGHAAELTRRALEEGFGRIIAVGGDGTVHETVCGYLASGETLRAPAAIGTWPAGSGCDLARHLRIPRRPQAWRLLLERPNIRRLDVGRIRYSNHAGRRTETYFLNMAGAALAGDVALRTQTHGKPWGGTASYLIHSLLATWKARAKRLSLEIDDLPAREESLQLIIVANTRSMGGGMDIAPRADAQDGRLDLVTVGDLSPWELALKFPLVYAGRHLGLAGLSHRHVRKIRISSKEPVPINIDGEAAGVLPAEIEIVPAAVPFLCPASSGE